MFGPEHNPTALGLTGCPGPRPEAARDVQAAAAGSSPEGGMERVAQEKRGGIERVVLVGFMCSGKSTIGDALARRLAWRFVDFDVAIAERSRMSVGELVEHQGEERLRELEAEITARAASESEAVLAPGGGWITRPELLERLGEGTLSVWLHASPAETVRRLEGDCRDRPLRGEPDALERVTAMMSERLPLYARADLRVETEGRGVEEIAYEIERVVRDHPL
jgi:shikimate kinase